MDDSRVSSRTDVSVIMPVYNVREFLADTLQSILSQSYERFEVIAIDDGSTDGSFDVLADFARRDPRLRIYRQEKNMGVGAIANECLTKATNELVVRMDGDDLMEPTRIERQVWFMRQHPNISAATSYAWLIDRNGKVLASAKPEIDMDRGVRELDPTCFVSMIHPAVIMRKSHIQAVGGYSNEYRFAEDRELWGRVVAAGYRLGVQSEYLVKQRLHGSSLTAINVRRNLLICDFIDQNIIRMLRGEPRLSYEQYVGERNSKPLLKRLARHANETSSILYRQATRDYAERKWWRFLTRSASAICLNPTWGLRMLRKTSGLGKSEA
jgi:glycosyltransferase involved in cell wall biosynthesis